MNRKIEFRGKRADNGGWVYGDLMTQYIHHEGYLTIVEGGCVYRKVIPETVGQLAPMTDKNDNKFYDGDIMMKIEDNFDSDAYHEWKDSGYEGEQPAEAFKKVFDVVTMDDYRYWLKNESFGYEGEDLESPSDWEVVGNIHDNPELIK